MAPWVRGYTTGDIYIAGLRGLGLLVWVQGCTTGVISYACQAWAASFGRADGGSGGPMISSRELEDGMAPRAAREHASWARLMLKCPG